MNTERDTREAPFRLSNLYVEVTQDAHGVNVRYVCCDQQSQYTHKYTPGSIETEILNHPGRCPGNNEIFRGDPAAKTWADLVTPKQLVAIRREAAAQAIDAQDECLATLKVKPEALSRRAASAFIDYLKKKAGQRVELERAG